MWIWTFTRMLQHDFSVNGKYALTCSTHCPNECSRKWIWSQFQAVAVLYLPDKSFMAYNFSLIIILMAQSWVRFEWGWYIFSVCVSSAINLCLYEIAITFSALRRVLKALRRLTESVHTCAQIHKWICDAE